MENKKCIESHKTGSITTGSAMVIGVLVGAVAGGTIGAVSGAAIGYLVGEAQRMEDKEKC